MLLPCLYNYYCSSLEHTSLLLQMNFSPSNISGTVPDALRKLLVPFSAFLYAFRSIHYNISFAELDWTWLSVCFPHRFIASPGRGASAHHIIEHWAPSSHGKVLSHGLVHWKSRPLLKGQHKIDNHTGSGIKKSQVPIWLFHTPAVWYWTSPQPVYVSFFICHMGLDTPSSAQGCYKTHEMRVQSRHLCSALTPVPLQALNKY